MEKRRSGHVSNRVSYACEKCRKLKIRCSGFQPCDKCSQRRERCSFDAANTKATRGYNEDLSQKSERREGSPAQDQGSINELENNDTQMGNVPSQEPTSGSQKDSNVMSVASAETKGQDLRNPLTTTPSRCLSSPNGNAFYLGTSSNWSFCRRALTLTYEYVRQAPLPTDNLLFDGFAYDADIQAERLKGFNSQSIPCLDHAAYLVSTVKFRCCQLLHLFSEPDVITNMHLFYSELECGRFSDSGLWYVQFLLILAFGKSLVQRKSKRPPGLHFFIRAVQLLPDVITLCREPITGTEILCSMAWYYQALDFRHAAHNLIVQAKSMAMNHGMHTDMSITDLGGEAVHRCRKIWWTICVLDGQMTYLMGLPQSSGVESISCQLPPDMGSAHRTAAFTMQMRLTQIIAETNTAIYGVEGRLNKTFVANTQAALNNTAQLHLLYYQSVVLATRPILFCCLIKRFETPTEAYALSNVPKLRHLLRTCVESSQQIVNILDCLRGQDQLESFIPLDLDALFVSTVVLLIARPIEPPLMDGEYTWLAKSFAILEEMIGNGNRIADFRKDEIELLCELIQESSGTGLSIPSTNGTTFQEKGSIENPAVVSTPQHSTETSVSQAFFQNGLAHNETEGPVEGDELTTEYILAMASSLDYGEIGWTVGIN